MAMEITSVYTEYCNRLYQQAMSGASRFGAVMNMKLHLGLLMGFCLSLAGPILAASKAVPGLNLAVAANFGEPAREIARAFTKSTGYRVVISSGPSGGLMTQISQGAPFDVFLSADVERPIFAENSGLTVKGSRFTYACGGLVLWSRNPGLVDNKGEVLRKNQFNKLAIADPASAPYGKAAIETLTSMGIYESVSPKLVKGGSIAQTFIFVATGSADLGFIARSQISGQKAEAHEGSSWLVPTNLHSPLAQQAVLLKTGANNRAALDFMAFLKSPEAVQIITNYGYTRACDR
jgi:molybdate transport system substrate-binding protein